MRAGTYLNTGRSDGNTCLRTGLLGHAERQLVVGNAERLLGLGRVRGGAARRESRRHGVAQHRRCRSQAGGERTARAGSDRRRLPCTAPQRAAVAQCVAGTHQTGHGSVISTAAVHDRYGIHIPRHAHVHRHVHAQIRTCTHTQAHAQTRTWTRHVHSYVYTRTHKHGHQHAEKDGSTEGQ